MKLEISQQIFEIYSNIKFNGNLSSGSLGVPCGRTDVTKLMVIFRNFANASKIAKNAFEQFRVFLSTRISGGSKI